jgi:hypothetical protein
MTHTDRSLAVRSAPPIGVAAAFLVLVYLVGVRPASDLATALTHLSFMAAAGAIGLLLKPPARRPALRFLAGALLATLLLIALRILETASYLDDGESLAGWAGRFAGEYVGRWAILGGLAALAVRGAFAASRTPDRS